MASSDVAEVGALYIERFGWNVTPVHFRAKDPRLHAWRSTRLTAQELAAHVNSTPSNLGVVLGEPSGKLVDVDLDFKGMVYDRVYPLAQVLLPTTKWRFGHGAKPATHLLFRCPILPTTSEKLEADGLGTTVEIRLTGQTVFPPSIHVSGEEITWDPQTDFAEGPPWVDYLDLRRAVYRLGMAAYFLTKFPQDGHEARLSLIGWLAKQGWPEDEVGAFVAAIMAARGHGHEDVAPAVSSTFHRLATNSPVAGFTACKDHFGFSMKMGYRLEEWEEAARPAGSTPFGAGLTLTEYGIAGPVAFMCSDDLRFCPEHQSWYVWDKTMWRADDSSVASKLVVEAVRRKRAKLPPGDPVVVEKQRKALLGMETRGKVESILHFMRPEAVTRAEQFDTNPWLFNCANGTLDLRYGTVEAHSPEHRITNCSDVVYDPSAEAPLFERFVAEVFPDPGIREFIQRLMGYCLTGLVDEHIFPIFHGYGGNGKSTFLGLIGDMMGTYATPLPSEVVTMSRFKSERHPTEVAVLYRRRFAVASESAMGRQLDESKVKELTGGDVIKTRKMREDFWTFRPTHKLILQTNYPPEIRGQDHGIGRRLIFISCEAKFEGDREVLGLKRQLKDELSGVLNWCLQGLKEWQKSPLKNRPAALVRKSLEFHTSQDEVLPFLLDRYVVTKNPADRVSASEMYTAYRAWCALNGAEVFGAKALAPQYRVHGLGEYRTASGKCWTGVRAKTAEELKDTQEVKS